MAGVKLVVLIPDPEFQGAYRSTAMLSGDIKLKDVIDSINKAKKRTILGGTPPVLIGIQVTGEMQWQPDETSESILRILTGELEDNGES